MYLVNVKFMPQKNTIYSLQYNCTESIFPRVLRTSTSTSTSTAISILGKLLYITPVIDTISNNKKNVTIYKPHFAIHEFIC